MSDLRLITILPPPPIQGVQQPQIAGNQAGKTGIAAIPIGSVLSGFIINRDNAGNPILRTESGDITFASNFFLKIGSEITIRIENFSGSNTAHILSVNGEPPEVAAGKSSFAQEPEVIVNVGRNTGSGASISAGASENVEINNTSQNPAVTVRGTIISTPQNSAPTQIPTPTVTQPLPNGSQIVLKITDIILPTNTPQTQAQTSPLPTPAAPQTATQTAPATQASPPPNYASYARFVASPEALPRAQNFSPRSTPTQPATPSPTQPAQVGQQITTTVISNDPNGEAIVQSPIGLIRLQAGNALPVGSQVTFEIAEIITSENAQIAGNIVVPVNATATPVTLTTLARNAGALSTIFTLLSGLNTTDALTFTNTIPSLGQQAATANNNLQNGAEPHSFMAALLGFTAAVKNGDFRQWLGKNNARWLEENGHENLLKKAEGEFASLSRSFTNPPPNQWQSLFFPIAIEGELQQTRLFIKRERKEKDNSGRQKQEEDTRFVLEMDMSALGEMQMDGFVKRNNQSIQFDLIIRSHTALSQEAQKDIMRIYNDMGELTGYAGSLVFQNVKEFPVKPMDDIIGADDIDDVVA